MISFINMTVGLYTLTVVCNSAFAGDFVRGFAGRFIACSTGGSGFSFKFGLGERGDLLLTASTPGERDLEMEFALPNVVRLASGGLSLVAFSDNRGIGRKGAGFTSLRLRLILLCKPNTGSIVGFGAGRFGVKASGSNSRPTMPWRRRRSFSKAVIRSIVCIR